MCSAYPYSVVRYPHLQKVKHYYQVVQEYRMAQLLSIIVCSHALWLPEFSPDHQGGRTFPLKPCGLDGPEGFSPPSICSLCQHIRYSAQPPPLPELLSTTSLRYRFLSSLFNLRMWELPSPPPPHHIVKMMSASCRCMFLALVASLSRRIRHHPPPLPLPK